MPRRIRPRLGWRSPSFRPGVPDADLKAIYSEALLAGIADELAIGPEAREALREAVLRAGALYRQSKPLADDQPTLLEAATLLELMARRASELAELFEDMDDVSWHYFWRAEHTLIHDCIRGSSSAMQAIGAYRQTDEDEWEFYTRDDFLPVLRLMELICRRATADVPPPARGPKRRVALREWVTALCDFWEARLGRPVTVDYQGTSVSSASYDFLVRLLRPLDPAAVGSLATVLREERTRRRRRN